MSASFLALEQAAGSGEVLEAVTTLLDELEGRGAFGSGEPAAKLRDRITTIARLRCALWVQRPEVVLADLYAHVLELPELEGVRREWQAVLDVRGPWLRPLRGWQTDVSMLAELRACESLPLERVIGLAFEGEHELVLTLRGSEEGASPERHAWSWLTGRTEPRATDESDPSGYRSDPRFEPGDDAPLYRPSPDAEARPLPWPDMGRADARMSADGRTIFVYGWYEDYDGLLLLVDAQSLAVVHRREFVSPVSQVIERPGTDALLVQTSHGLYIVDADGFRWHRSEESQVLAWSPSGRYVSAADRETVRIIDTQTPPTSKERPMGLPTTFSPDGARLVDGSVLLDGRTGTTLARLGVELGSYLEGGPAWPWWHVGTELVVCIHGATLLWDSRSGEPVPIGGHLCTAHWYSIAYSTSGRHFVWGSGPRVTLGALPSVETLAKIDFGFKVEALALDASAQRVAAYGGGRVEVRERDGSLVGTSELPVARKASSRPLRGHTFSLEEERLSLSIAETTSMSWDREGGRRVEVRPAVGRVWALGTEGLSPIGDEPVPQGSLPSGWEVQPGTFSTFVHDSGARVIVPCRGPWLTNPSQRSIVACPGGVFELRAPPSSGQE